jgi:transposase
VTIDAEEKQRAFIKFLLLEGYAGEKITMRLRNTYRSAAYCLASALNWINEVRRGKEELRNEQGPRRPNGDETDAAIRSILQEDSNASLGTIAETLSTSPETHAYVADRLHPGDLTPGFLVR